MMRLEALMIEICTPEILTSLEKSMASPTRVVKPTDIPSTKPGHYVILSDKAIPEEACRNHEDIIVNDLYIWYNGTTSGSLRGRLRHHLFRPKHARLSSSSANAIKVSKVSASEIPTISQNFKHSEEGDYWELGTDIRDSKWEDYKFYVVVDEVDLFANPVEQIFRQTYGIPPLVIGGKR